MTTLAAPNLAGRNRLECVALYAVLQGLPVYSCVALLMKLTDASRFAREPFGAALFVATVALLHSLVTPWLGPKFPHVFRHNFEPLFADPTLSFSDKVSRWLAQPKSALQLLSNALLLSVLAIGAAGMG